MRARITGSRAAASALAVGGILGVAGIAIVGCGDEESGRAAAAVSASTSGSIVTDSSTDLGSIVIGWGEQHTDTEITTPRPQDISARCHGEGEELSVELAAPHGWRIAATHGSQVLVVENADQDFTSADLDTTNHFLPDLRAVDWSQPDQVDIAAVASAPANWSSPFPDRRVYVSVHVDCRQK